MRSLPIDPLLPEVVRVLAESRTLVLTAEPGAGKTTRVPVSLLDAKLGTGKILVSEPRRLPARLAATFVAAERGEAVGRAVGYSVRFEHVATEETRLVYATEGVVLRRLLEAPTLPGVDVVILDEVHERHLTTDLLLALLRRLQEGARPDLRLVAMSATVDAAALATHLGAPHLHSEGRAFPLTVEHDARPDDRPLESRVATAVKRLLREEATGDVLVFLPGARDIRRCLDALAGEAASGVLVLPLHGDLSVAEQARAVEPSSKRRVILSTNVAESSVTIDGVTAVVDSGLVRMAGHSPWSGLPTLTTAKISRASATQRGGRAGRTRPGRVLRLYTAGDLATRPEHDKPEIVREDLSEAMLSLHGVGVTDPSELSFLDAPPPAALAAAETLLARLGAVTRDGKLTPIGKQMLELPLPPRLARVVVEGRARGVAAEAGLAAALLSERDIRVGARTDVGGRGGGRGGGRSQDLGGPSDVLELMDRFSELRDERFDPRRASYMGLDARAGTAVDRIARQIAGMGRGGPRAPRPDGMEAVDREVQLALLAGFPDRIARRRTRGERALTLFSGKSARLADTSVVHDATLLIALDAEDVGREVVVRLASAIEADWLMELFPDMVEMTDELVWNSGSELVERVSRIAFGSVVLDEEKKPAPPSPEASAVLLKNARASAAELDPDGKATGLTHRLALIAEHFPELAVPASGATAIDAALAHASEGRTRLSELRGVDLEAELLAALEPGTRALVERETPARLTLPGGRGVAVHYEPGKPPWVESRLQDFFGMTRTPTVVRGRVPLTVHLLAPNQRAVQVTSDLAGFWERHYPELRRELSRRYPRHAWPEDGRTAVPPPPLPPRRRD
ncbi:MAG TPA: ATP-dependent helicase C-terminal domain-containing protein [Polyangiaceae bacterium]|nr:ATP-dependent helicase C-terminal domain-containing protein [Polyangiaceae bacterium]